MAQVVQSEQQPFAPDERIGQQVRCCDTGFVGWIVAIRGRQMDVKGIEQERRDVPLVVIEWLSRGLSDENKER